MRLMVHMSTRFPEPPTYARQQSTAPMHADDGKYNLLRERITFQIRASRAPKFKVAVSVKPWEASTSAEISSGISPQCNRRYLVERYMA